MFSYGRGTRSFKQRVLYEAIQANDYLKVEELVSSDVDVSEDQAALELAVSTGKTSIARLLIQSGCCVNEPNDVQFRAMDMAVYRSFNDIVEILTEAGFDITVRNGYSESRLHIAACGNNELLLSRLLHGGFDPDETTNSWTACHVLAARNHVKTLKVLLRFGCDVDARTNEGATPLSLALERNHLSPCFLLVDAGCDLRDAARRLNVSYGDEEEGAIAEDLVEEAGLFNAAQDPSSPQPEPPSPQIVAERRRLSDLIRRRLFEKPHSLKDLARMRVRRALRVDIERKSKTLPLPPQLAEYVCDIFSDEKREQ